VLFGRYDECLILQVEIEHRTTRHIGMVAGLIYLHLQTADKKFQQKISFGI
jgi:hypothetical protein